MNNKPFCPVYYDNGDGEVPKPNGWVPVDEWVPQPEDVYYKSCKGRLIIPVSKFYNISGEQADNLDTFSLASKRCYNGDKMRFHLPQYLNYFEKFYDQDKELFSVTATIKYLIDYQQGYTKDIFVNDIKRYILSDSIKNKAHYMNEHNYLLDLDSKKYHNDKNPSLTYRDRHAKALLWMSLLMNMCIPLLTHYIFVHSDQVTNSNEFLLEVFDYILDMPGMDIYNKLFETCHSNVYKSSLKQKVLWDMQPIRGKNVTTHTLDSVKNIILNIMPKYAYNSNIISLNFVSIKRSNGYQIENIGWEYEYVSLSNSKRDAENNSVFDKFESYLIKQNESLYLLNKTAAEETMKMIEIMYGPFDKEEIDYYIERLEDIDGNIINNFQKSLIFLLFLKYFGDPQTICSINKVDYVKLMIAASRILASNRLVALPYIISSKVEKMVSKKTVNKRELEKIKSSKWWKMVWNKYEDEKIENIIISMLATILSSEFRIIDYNDKELDGQIFNKDYIAEYIGEEVLMYITLI